MTVTPVDLESWPRAAQFHWFRTFEKPHYATTSRIDVTRLMRRKSEGVSLYRASLWAIGEGMMAVPELRMRFEGEAVWLHDGVTLSMTVPKERGGFNFGYVPHLRDFEAYDRAAAELIAEASRAQDLSPNSDTHDDLAYASCMPWIDFTSINNALPHARDCIPRVSWGKIVETAKGYDMAMAIEVHHALVDGEQVGAYFRAVQHALDSI